MFQLSSVGGSANFRNENEREIINSKILQFQEIHGDCGSFKELFERILNVALEKQKTVEVFPENALYIGVDPAEFHRTIERIEDFKTAFSISPETSISDVLNTAFEKAAFNRLNKPVIQEVPIELPENAVIVKFSDSPQRPVKRKMEILQLIQSRRMQKFGLLEPESFGSIVEKLVFSEGALYNHGGDEYTGL